jgi:hypothetical protein
MTSRWWLSFCDPDKAEGSQFLGVAIVEGANLVQATSSAWRHKCNPGGEILGVQLPHATHVSTNMMNRLLTRNEAEALDKNLREPS